MAIEAAREAKEDGIIICTVGMGSDKVYLYQLLEMVKKLE